MPPQDPRNIEINLFNYELPPSRIAQYPVQERDSSKLLIFKDGNIGQDLFYNLPGFIPENSLMLFNETRVIRARLHFQKETGAIIEIFLLDPVHPTPDIQTAFGQTGTCTWNCLVGNSKRWKHGILRATTTDQDLNIILFAKRKSQEGGSFLIEFSWEPSYLSLATLLEKFGKIPLPPYINRPVNEADNDRYQTVYARNDGSVAAPTAGLHFTDRVLKGLLDRKVNFESVTLHVGAGTFKPVVSKMLGDHEMHFEQLAVSRNTIVSILNNLNHPIGYVGTTTARTIESLYWQGVKWLINKNHKPVLRILQWDPYELEFNRDVPVKESLECIIELMDHYGMHSLQGSTQLLIAPGYSYRIPRFMITNFHQPGSTLLLLIAAFIGKDWKKVYHYALKNDFRFLSYGDSCLFYRK